MDRNPFFTILNQTLHVLFQYQLQHLFLLTVINDWFSLFSSSTPSALGGDLKDTDEERKEGF